VAVALALATPAAASLRGSLDLAARARASSAVPLPLALFAIALLLLHLIRRWRGQRQLPPPLTATTLHDRLASGAVAVVVDVRDAADYRAGHIPGALSLPLPELDHRLAELNGWRRLPVAVVCRTDKRSAVAVQRLRAAGFATPILVRGGMRAWGEAGLEVAASDAPIDRT